MNWTSRPRRPGEHCSGRRTGRCVTGNRLSIPARRGEGGTGNAGAGPQDAASELSYVAFTSGHGSAAGSRPSVAVIVPFITRWFFSHRHRRSRRMCSVIAGTTRCSTTSAVPISGTTSSKGFRWILGFEGILTLSMPLTEEHTLALRALDLPMVSVGTTVPGSPSVGIDEGGAARGGGQPPGAPAARTDRVHRRRARRSPLRVRLLRCSPPRVRAGVAGGRPRRRRSTGGIGRRTVQRAGQPQWHNCWPGRSCRPPSSPSTTNSRSEPSGLCGDQDWMYRAMSRSSVWTITRWSQMLDLTTVAQSVAAQGEIAAELLVQVLQDEADGGATRPVVLPTRLVLRGTTSPPATARSTPRLRRISKGRQGSQR